MAAYTVQKVTTREELDGLVDACWKAWADPYMPSNRIALPIHGFTEADRARSIIASKDRMWNEFTKMPKSKYWVYARHTASGDVVGGVRMDFVEASPFPNGCPKLDMYWWPEGEEIKEFCEEMMQQVYTPRSLWMQRPHGGMTNLFVHPSHRGRGVAKLILECNTRELDQRGIEGYVEATDLGRPAYESAGYQVVMKVDSYIPTGKTNSDNWNQWYHEMGVTSWYAMWRPKHGKIEAGERTRPWQQGIPIPVENSS